MNREDIDRIWITDDAIWIETNDGLQASEPLAAYTRLRNAPKDKLENYTVSYYGIHWPEIDEDLSFDGFFKQEGHD